MNLNDYGFMPDMMPANTDGIPARITAVHRERYALVCEYGEAYGRLKSKSYFAQEYPVGCEEFPTPGRGEQAVAANFDYVFIMQSLNQDFNRKRLERYLTLAWQSGTVPVVILTKADLLEEYSDYVRSAEKTAAGVAVHAVSSRTGEGMDALAAYMMPGKTVVFLGSSGVGKSSLVNALANEEIMAVQEIREDDSKGRHTTTHRQLIMLQNGTMIIDTPGMRELGMCDVTVGLGEAFADVEQFLGQCRFSDCKHQTEPGCAIKEAIANGELSKMRWESYRKLGSEAKYADDKDGFLRQKQQRNKDIAKFSRRLKSAGRKSWRE